jgi:hypothetical protein
MISKQVKVVMAILSVLVFRAAFAASPAVTVTENANSIGRYGIYEVALAHTGTYANPWENVNITARFTAPTGRIDTISGFYYDANTWKVRFAPTDIGNWTWTIDFNNGESTVLTGDLTCVASTRKGFLKRHPTNPFRIIYSDGSLFAGVGLGDCVYIGPSNGVPNEPLLWSMNWTASRSTTTYLNAYGAPGAGFIMFRWSTNNCSFNLASQISASGNTYLNLEGKSLDLLCDSLQKYGLAVWIGLFGYSPAFTSSTGNSAEGNAVKRYLKYMVARYGAYADVWEIMNETTAPDAYVDFTSAYVKSIDPYDRMFTANSVDNGGWQTPNIPSVDINTPHWYELTSDIGCVAAVAANINGRRGIQKPIIYGEKGWSGHNWDATSALRMRLEDWTAFFCEAEFLWWNQSGSKTYQSGAGNCYIGPEEQGYAAAMAKFIRNTDPDVIRYTITPSNTNIEAFGLRSNTTLLAYFHNKSSHTATATTNITVDVPVAGDGFWYNPSTGDTISKFTAVAGSQTLTTPSFMIDLALKITGQGSTLARKSQKLIKENSFKMLGHGNSFAIPINVECTSQNVRIALVNSRGESIALLYDAILGQGSHTVFVEIPPVCVGQYYLFVENSEHASVAKQVLMNR